jgi:nitrogen fixation/metabolism regulation signal transduction histidine kinase
MKKANRLAWVVALVATTGAALVLAFLLAVATGRQDVYERHFALLFGANALVAGLLVLVILVTAVRLGIRLAQGRFGGRLLLKLAGIFAVLAIVPGMLIYTVSYQFVSRSIESWFDVKVEAALQAGLDLARPMLSARMTDLRSKAQAAADQLADAKGSVTTLALERLREQVGCDQMALLGADGSVVLSVSRDTTSLALTRPGLSLLSQARAANVASKWEGLDDEPPGAAGASPRGTAAGANATLRPAARAQVLVRVPGRGFDLLSSDRFLWVSDTLPTDLVVNAKLVESAYKDYNDLSAGRQGLRKMYIGTLTLALILAVFGALLLSVVLAKQLAKPLLLLAEGMRQVAKGDLSTKPVFASNDELGWLTRSFADMTEQLAEARLLVHRSVAQVEASRSNLQTILDNLSAGVIVFNREGLIETVNPGATRIVRLALSAYRGRSLADVTGLEGFAQAVDQRFQVHLASPDATEREQWQDSFELEIAGPPSADGQRERITLTLLVRGAMMPQGARLIVFDDITELVSAQRTEAWAEVARRLAHEIKNPLTPIQLSAERLEHKLAAKLEAADQGMLSRAVATIVNQVQAMKRLVNEFRDYARLPAAQFRAVDLNALVAEVLLLYATEQESARLRTQLEVGLPLIEGDVTQLRQVIHNLVQNALDAVAELQQGQVRVTTETSRDERGALRSVRLLVVDNGPGFPEKVLKRAFEPYVTTKAKGTGLGLAVVKKIADEHGARVRVANLGSVTADSDESPGVRGAQVSLSFSRFAPVEGAPTAAGKSPG